LLKKHSNGKRKPRSSLTGQTSGGGLSQLLCKPWEFFDAFFFFLKNLFKLSDRHIND